MILISSIDGWIAISRKVLSGCVYITGAGVSPLFPPVAATEEETQADLNEGVAADPAQYGIPRTRWTLECLLPVIQKKGYHLGAIGSLHQFLAHLGIRLVQARYSHRSPDPDYQAKLDYIEAIKKRVKKSRGREVALYLDECNYYRQPLLAPCWTSSDQPQERAKRSERSNTRTRILGALDVKDGRVFPFQAPVIPVTEYVKFYQRLHEAYPNAKRIWVIQDNNPVHFHANLLVALEKQKSPFPMKLAPNWSEIPDEWAVKRYGHLKLPIQIVQTPTYAPWCNPCEKVWKYFRQEFLHVNWWDLASLLRGEKGHCLQNGTPHRGCLKGHGAQECRQERAYCDVFPKQLLIVLLLFGRQKEY
jgi:DDE superfamily endonuclease